MPNSRPMPLRVALGRLEASIGVFFAALFAFGVFCAGVIALVVPHRWDWHYVLGIPVWVLAVIAECMFILKLKVSLDNWHRIPFVPWFSLQLGDWQTVHRPLVAVWWIAHFALAVEMALIVDSVIASCSMSPVAIAICYVCVDFTIVYCANLYLLLTITSLGGGETIVNRAWKWRFVLDLLVGIAAAMVPNARHVLDI